MNEESPFDSQEEPKLAALLTAVGSRSQPSAEAMAAVRSAVEAEWRTTVAARQRQRRLTTWAAAAGMAVAAVAVWIARPIVQSDAPVVASLTRVVGDVRRSDGDGRWMPLDADAALEAGTRLRTGPDGQVAMRLHDGVELRLDSATLVAFDDAGQATLSQGAVYVDIQAEPGRPSPGFVLQTPAGAVRHLGTQYEARLVDAGLRVAIREGRVQVGGPRGHEGVAGEQLTIRDGRVERAELAPHATQWNWLSTITPPFRLEGRSVDEFLAWAGRETGRTIVYAAPAAARQARAVTLSGTLEGLTPDDALDAVLSTTSLRATVESGRISIETTAR